MKHVESLFMKIIVHFVATSFKYSKLWQIMWGRCMTDSAVFKCNICSKVFRIEMIICLGLEIFQTCGTISYTCRMIISILFMKNSFAVVWMCTAKHEACWEFVYENHCAFCGNFFQRQQIMNSQVRAVYDRLGSFWMQHL